MNKQAYLILENGAVFEGVMLGAETEVIGEVVFTTAMTGYLETLTDPSYYGQIVVQTFPLMGNYGVIPQVLKAKSRNCALCDAGMLPGALLLSCARDVGSVLKTAGHCGAVRHRYAGADAHCARSGRDERDDYQNAAID